MQIVTTEVRKVKRMTHVHLFKISKSIYSTATNIDSILQKQQHLSKINYKIVTKLRNINATKSYKTSQRKSALGNHDDARSNVITPRQRLVQF